MKEEDRVVHLLASLPEPYTMLVTTLKASSDVPKMEVVTERLLHEEKKQKKDMTVTCPKVAELPLVTSSETVVFRMRKKLSNFLVARSVDQSKQSYCHKPELG